MPAAAHSRIQQVLVCTIQLLYFFGGFLLKAGVLRIAIRMPDRNQIPVRLLDFVKGIGFLDFEDFEALVCIHAYIFHKEIFPICRPSGWIGYDLFLNAGRFIFSTPFCQHSPRIIQRHFPVRKSR